MAGYGRRVDTHEMLKSIAFADPARSPLGEHFPVGRPSEKRAHGISDQYVVLDTALCSGADPATGKFAFNLSPQKAAGKKTIGVRDTLKTIIEIQTYKFCMPLPLLTEIPTEHPTLTLAANTPGDDPRLDTDPIGGLAAQLAHCPRVTLYLEEAGEQCNHDFKSRKHHFEYEASLVGTIGDPGARMLLTPINSIYVFTTPLTDLHGITMQFFGPDSKLRFPPDELRNVRLTTQVLGDDRITVSAIGTDGVAVSLSDILSPGDRIFFDNVKIGVVVTAGGTTQENLERELNAFLMREDGLHVGSFPTATTMITDPSIVSASFVAGGETLPLLSSVTMRIAKNRMRAPFRMRRVIEGATNYIDP